MFTFESLRKSLLVCLGTTRMSSAVLGDQRGNLKEVKNMKKDKRETNGRWKEGKKKRHVGGEGQRKIK